MIEPQILVKKRTEYGKAIRKAYENHQIYEKIGNMVELEPRKDGMAQTITTVLKDNIVIVAQRGRYTDDGKTEQKLEIGSDICSNAITTVQKDVMLMENNKNRYRIRKLTPKECWRLMGIKDSDYEKAAEINSSTQLYKQAGNGICVNVLMALFSQLGIPNVVKWNDLTENERYGLFA